MSGIVKVSGEHCLQVAWSKVVEGLNKPSSIILRIITLLLFISERELNIYFALEARIKTLDSKRARKLKKLPTSSGP